ncbi:YdgA family protein [Pseudomonas sp. NPDC087612]|uniref:YdgA family protein n=1 Tax=unclassified Pseudomonas TaxID=196821 RepID=UPI0015A35F02|nr:MULTISPECIES: YdgA family protein [unclassified Pseudomonas]QVM95524.1 YdgA family protein [Pseudomonas sp. SORT22]UVL57611.1 YdgA family protein [Pseudomonas sp. B21-035]
MKKSTGVLGLAVAVAAVCTAGAWYTGKQLPGVLATTIAESNAQTKQALVGMDTLVELELVSLDSHLFSSTAKYRLKVKNLQVGEDSKSFELNFVDQIEHGPLPLSRVKALKLMPVMAASHYSLEKDAATADWFALTKDVSPLQGQVAYGYDRSMDSAFQVAPIEWSKDGSSLKFSGFEVTGHGNEGAEHVQLTGQSGGLSLNLVDPDSKVLKVEIKGLSLTGDMTKTPFGFYVGKMDMAVADTVATFGDEQKVLKLKGLAQNNEYKNDGDKLSARMEYKVGDINFDGKAIGAGEMVWSLKRLDIPAMQALIGWYQSRLPEFQQAAAEGAGMPDLAMTEAETAQVRSDVQRLLAAKPQIALENLSFKTANGESRFSFSVDLANPTSLELPPEELSKQLITQLQSKLSLSKPMIGDLATLQAQFEGQTDAAIVSQQAAQAGEMVSMMAVQSQMAKVEGNDIVTSLHYADGMVDFNGQKMTVEQFASVIMANASAMQATGG